jgi:hypothetical protein
MCRIVGVVTLLPMRRVQTPLTTLIRRSRLGE